VKYTYNEITGKLISKIGLGCVTFGREIDRSASFRMMDYACSNGITFFDTAAAYGNGISESIIGEWIANRRAFPDSIFIATKLLPPYRPDIISASVLKSLERLGTATIDLLYFHRWDETARDPEVYATLGDLMRQGKIRLTGASNFTAEQLSEMLKIQVENGLPAFGFIQNNNNVAVRDVNAGLISLCSENNISVVTYSPLAAGFLTGKHKQGVQPGSRFDIVPGHQAVYFNEKAYQRLDKLRMISESTGYPMAHLALAWALHQPGVTSVLTGGRIPEQIGQALSAMYFDEPLIFEQLDDE
jgi:1-deoxyxylulose-5-phosphate synthase